MSLLRGDDLKTNFIQASSVFSNFLVGSQLQNKSPITAFLNAQPTTFNSINGTFTVLNVEGAQGYTGQTMAFHTSKPFAVVNPGNSVITETGAGSGAGGMLLYTENAWKLIGGGGGGSGNISNNVTGAYWTISGDGNVATMTATDNLGGGYQAGINVTGAQNFAGGNDAGGNVTGSKYGIGQKRGCKRNGFK